MKILSRNFYERDTPLVAQELLGKKIIREISSGSYLEGIIVETEAYVAQDEACHAFKGKTNANRALFETVGHAYIYFIYGNHYCLNFVARSKSSCAGGVLIRALEPQSGIDSMQQYRNVDSLKNLTNGPGKLAQALHITKSLYGLDVTQRGPLYVTEGIKVASDLICATQRIGISKAKEKKWRFYICNNEFVSKIVH